MAAMFQQGITMERIGESYGITRERVRQILRVRSGLSGFDGGAHVSAVRKKGQKDKARDAAALMKYGVSIELLKKLQRNGATRAYAYQKRGARYRTIEWDLSLGDWWRIWDESGKWEQRGRGKGKYVMARINDDGGYAIGNVYVISVEENGREYQRTKGEPRTRVACGIYLALPGYAKPYLAKVGKKNLGYHLTADDAMHARSAFIESRAGLK